MTQTRKFACRGESIGQARRFVREALPDASPEAREATELMVSELATNCIQHARSAFEIQISRDAESIRVETRDCGEGHPTPRSPTPLEPRGRGLRIVEALSELWGIEPRPTGKMVWFTIGPGPSGGERSLGRDAA